MRRAYVLLLAFAVCPAFAGLIEGRVIEVADGDSLTVLSREGASRHRVRLTGIAVPAKENPLWDRSRENLRRLAVGKFVRVDTSTIDGKGRLVGTVWILQNAKDCRIQPCREKVDASQVQLSSGLAWVDKDQSARHPPETQKVYADAERWAKDNKVGLWRESGLPLRAELRDPAGAFAIRADSPGPQPRR